MKSKKPPVRAASSTDLMNQANSQNAPRTLATVVPATDTHFTASGGSPPVRMSEQAEPELVEVGHTTDRRAVRVRVQNVSEIELPPQNVGLVIDQPRTGPEYRLSGRWVDGGVVKVWSKTFPNRAALFAWKAGRWSTVSRGRP
jgi:hypothetical protein